MWDLVVSKTKQTPGLSLSLSKPVPVLFELTQLETHELLMQSVRHERLRSPIPLLWTEYIVKQTTLSAEKVTHGNLQVADHNLTASVWIHVSGLFLRQPSEHSNCPIFCWIISFECHLSWFGKTVLIYCSQSWETRESANIFCPDRQRALQVIITHLDGMLLANACTLSCTGEMFSCQMASFTGSFEELNSLIGSWMQMWFCCILCSHTHTHTHTHEILLFTAHESRSGKGYSFWVASNERCFYSHLWNTEVWHLTSIHLQKWPCKKLNGIFTPWPISLNKMSTKQKPAS